MDSSFCQLGCYARWVAAGGWKSPQPPFRKGAFGLRVSILLPWMFFRVWLLVKIGNWG